MSIEIKDFLPRSQIKNAPIDCYAFARDAGFYRLIPKLVVQARNIQEISKLFEFASQNGRKLVFRAGGTSLSGQSISDDILVEVNQGWKDIKVKELGQLICLGGGVIGSRANQALISYNRRIGPDPGSMKAAFISGIVANNASGIGSGIKYNSYNTLHSLVMVLANGLILNSAKSHADTEFKEKAPEMYLGILRLRDQVRNSKNLAEKIRHKYRLKNTSGYTLNSFLDYDKPIDILSHLLVGSEGTLGFISQVNLHTVEVYAHKATALVFFNSLVEAAKYVPLIAKHEAAALEIMDDSAIRAVKHVRGLPEIIYTQLPVGIAALLLEFEADDSEILQTKISTILSLLKAADLYVPATFSSSAWERELLWNVRRELGPLHAANRPVGTTVLSEDICFETKDLAPAIQDLQDLFKKFGYHDAIVFGHAREGNLHFKLSIDFDRPGAVTQYGEFMEKLVDLVIDKYDGSLKAEHGTGRNMAPFLEREWGKEAVQVMRGIKNILDPLGILNPDVILSDDALVHLKNIKPIPQVNPIIDPCIECGMCEKWCPSADLTLSPRRRIGVLRELKILELGSVVEMELGKTIQREFKYSGVDTCAADGLCAIGCPVDINTGDLMKHFRHESHSAFIVGFSRFMQKHYGRILKLIRGSLILGKPLLLTLKFKGFGKVASLLPRWTNHLIPALSDHIRHTRSGLPEIRRLTKSHSQVVYFPSCINRVFGDPKEKLSEHEGVVATFLSILETAGIQAVYPQKVEHLCCGLTFSSKGLNEASLAAAIQTTEMLWLASSRGILPIVMDTSPCSYQLKNYDKILSGELLEKWKQLQIFDVSEYLHDCVLPALKLKPVPGEAILHPTCSTIKMGIDHKMLAVARACAETAVIPEDSGCCGFAGDRGLFFPELTQNAVKYEARSVKQCTGAAGHFSTSRTCEIGMSLGTGQTYSSLVYLLKSAIDDSPSNSTKAKP